MFIYILCPFQNKTLPQTAVLFTVNMFKNAARLSGNYVTLLTNIFKPLHDISNNVVCATSKASDQPVHTSSLIRVFASTLNILLLLSY